MGNKGYLKKVIENKSDMMQKDIMNKVEWTMFRKLKPFTSQSKSIYSRFLFLREESNDFLPKISITAKIMQK